MKLKIYFLFAFSVINCLVSKILNQSVSPKIIPLSLCKAQLNDGRLIDLTSLDNPANPRVAEDSGFRYKFNPCSPISCEAGLRASAAICQETSDGELKYDCGDQSSVSFSQESDIFTMSFKASFRQSTVKCICSKTESFSGGENPVESSRYEFTFNSPCCCPDGCSGKKPGKSGGLSFGSVLLIIFFSLMFGYFIGGFVFLKFYKKNSGPEIIPNHQFWTSMPGYIKDGVSFTFSKVKGTPYQQF